MGHAAERVKLNTKIFFSFLFGHGSPALETAAVYGFESTRLCSLRVFLTHQLHPHLSVFTSPKPHSLQQTHRN